jgi:hypothetical protein
VDHRQLQTQLSLLHCILGARDQSAIMRATLAHVVFVGAHPFVDGNGRIARILFNAVLINAGLSPASYIPLKELYAVSRGSMSVHCRRALVQRDWTPVLCGMATAIRLTFMINKRIAPRKIRRRHGDPRPLATVWARPGHRHPSKVQKITRLIDRRIGMFAEEGAGK